MDSQHVTGQLKVYLKFSENGTWICLIFFLTFIAGTQEVLVKTVNVYTIS